MRLIPVALALFYRGLNDGSLEVWTQVRTDDGPFHGLLEFPGGGIEPGEDPLQAVVREVDEEVGIQISAQDARLMGTYANEFPGKTVLLYVFLFPDQEGLKNKGEWLKIVAPERSEIHRGKIPAPNHKIIDDLYAILQK